MNRLFLLFVLCLFCIGFGFNQSLDITRYFFSTISEGLVIGTPNNLNLGSVIAGNTIEVDFSDYFWIEDLRGIDTGHYTTIQCDGLFGPNNYIITGVQMSGNFVYLIGGKSSNTLIDSNLNSWTDITKPQLYFYRNNNPSIGGAVNRYGNKPSIKITIPVDAPAGTYTGKITYTLYDTSFNY